MSRPGAWGRVVSNLWSYLKKDWSTKNYIGEDYIGHRFYEIKNSRQNVSRGFEPPAGQPKSQPGQEWQAWLRGTRRFPPSDKEIALNAAKQQKELSDNLKTQLRSPSVHSEGKNPEKPTSYPKYEDLEVVPGHKKA